MVKFLLEKDRFSRTEYLEICSFCVSVRETIAILIKEYVSREPFHLWESGPTMTLMEAYVTYYQLGRYLDSIMSLYPSNADIAIASKDKAILKIYIDNIELFERELKHLHFIMLKTVETC